MKTGIHIQGGQVDRESVEALAGAVKTIFKSAAKHNMDQSTVRDALDLLGRLGTVEGTTVNNTSVNG